MTAAKERQQTGSSSAAVNREYYGELSRGRDDYWKLMAAPRARAETFARLVESFHPSTLADLGCGNGSLLRVLGAIIPTAELMGIDLSESQIEMNRQEIPRMTWLTHDLSGEKPLPPALEGRFEVVTASEIVEHVDRPKVFLQQARRLARAGVGHLVLSTQSSVIRETERRVGHRKHFAASEMRELLERSGWTPVRVWNEGFPFHDLSKWYANLDAEGSMRRFGEHSYGWSERLVCFALRALFKLNSRSRGAQLYAVARARS